jgi:probable rRNA maturation factor
VQYRVARRGVPAAGSLRRWALAVASAPVSIVVVGASEGRRLNAEFRGRRRATNVLSFPYGKDAGDVVLCHPVIAREARAQGKTLAAHYAHLVVHGVLHLRGRRHERARDARRMEREEIRALRRFGLRNPYEIE